jgi:hypothetical protein
VKSSDRSRFALPEGGAARLFSFEQNPAFPWCVIAAPTPERARPQALFTRRHVSALLTHDEGLSWPDARGEALAAAIFDHGGAVAFAFVNLADALACKRRLEGGAA